MATITEELRAVYRDEKEESTTLERFCLMRRGEARDELKRLIRDGEFERAFDLVKKNTYAALYVVRDKRLASIEGKGWILGLQAVLFQVPAKWHVIRYPHSDVAKLRVNPERSKWMYSIVEQARRA